MTVTPEWRCLRLATCSEAMQWLLIKECASDFSLSGNGFPTELISVVKHWMRTVYLTHLVKMATISLVFICFYFYLFCASQVHFSFVEAHKDKMIEVLMKMFLKAPLLYHDFRFSHFQLNKFGSLASAHQHFEVWRSTYTSSISFTHEGLRG